jgi:hypothetical protein
MLQCKPAKQRHGSLEHLPIVLPYCVALVLLTVSVFPSGFAQADPLHPRPLLMRSNWFSLNGSWQLDSLFWMRTNGASYPDSVEIPFPAGALRGKYRLVTENHRLWYRHRFSIPKSGSNQRTLLHFEAADWETKVWLNGKDLGGHQGGYNRFSFDITEALKLEGDQELVVSVYDPTESGFQPRGKQALHPDKFYFHATSGIWQTVWLEFVATTSIESLRSIPDIDAGVLRLTVYARGKTNGFSVRAIALDGETEVGRINGGFGESLQLRVPDAKLWSPDSPLLYDLKVEVLKDGTIVDSVSSYFGMRKISITKDEAGIPRLMLNNQRLFQLGTLDQGYWPEGRYAAPSDDALRWDIETMKQLGFNMVRKHVKVEPERWYYWCDKLGLLVWQDMPNGDKPASNVEKEIERKPESARLFEQDLKRMILGRGNHPSIVVWAPFNQGWGQYDTARITDLVKELDPSRLVISASGWHDMGTGDIRSYHNYGVPDVEFPGDGRVSVLGECGGLGLAVPGHLWGAKGTWNVRYYPDAEALLDGYSQLMSIVRALAEKKGLSAAVVTQFSDVETELNGFVTYDRAVIKMPIEKVREINQRVIRIGSGMGKN